MKFHRIVSFSVRWPSREPVHGPFAVAPEPLCILLNHFRSIGWLSFFCRSFSRARLRANSCARRLLVFCFPGSSPTSLVPSQNAAVCLGSSGPRFWVPQENGTEKGDSKMSYLNSVTIVGFVGAHPEQHTTVNNGSKFTVLSVATERSWKNQNEEWNSKTEWHSVCIF